MICMYEVGDLIMYGGEGVCRVEEIGCPDIPSIDHERTYYTLSPLYRDGRTYAPVDTKVFMRPVISYDEAQALISRIPGINPNACEEGNLRMLTEHYEEHFKTRDCADLVQLIKTVYIKRKTALENKKKLGLVDERYMKRAEDMLYGELAVALDIPRDDVRDYIAHRITDFETV